MAKSKKDDRNIHERAIRAFDNIIYVQQGEREEMLQDRRFVTLAGGMWEGSGWAQQFANKIRVEVNLLRKTVNKVLTDYATNRTTVDFRPALGTPADTTTAKTLNGLFRADVYRSKGQQAFDNAFLEGYTGGMGAWWLANEPTDEFDPDDDTQRIAIKLITDADQKVFFDLDAQLYDKSDAKRAYVLEKYTADGFEDAFPAAEVPMPTSWPVSLYKPIYDWYQPDLITVANVYQVEIVDDERQCWVHSISGEKQNHWKSDLDDEDARDLREQGWRKKSTKICKRRRVHRWVMSGSEILRDYGIIAGDCIPIIPFYGWRAWIDNIERAQGAVRMEKDKGRLLNAELSKLAETSALSPVERPVFYPEEVAGLESMWASANIDNAAFALRKPLRDLSGNPIPSGPLVTLQPPSVAPATATMLQLTMTLFADEAQDGADKVVANTSAMAMDIAAARVDSKSFMPLDNFRLSMERCGEVYSAMARDVYVEEGREVEALDADGKTEAVKLLQSKTDAATGRNEIVNNLQAGRYYVVASTTEATATRKDKTVNAMLEVAKIAGTLGAQEIAVGALVTAILNTDGEGMDDFQALMRQKALQIGLVQPTDDEKAQLAQSQQNQAPDPAAVLAEAQGTALKAQAMKDIAQAENYSSQTDLNKAKTVDTMAEAQATTQAIHASTTAVIPPAESPNPLDVIEKIAKVRHLEAGTEHMNARRDQVLGPAHPSMGGPPAGRA